MKTSKIKLAERMLKETTAYELGQVSYKAEKETLLIWSNNSPNGALHSLGLVSLFNEIFHCLASYNDNEKRIELNVF